MDREDLEALLRERVRDVPDFPRPGIGFKDISPLLADHAAFAAAVDAMVAPYGRGSLAKPIDKPIDKVVGIEARGFILAAPVAYHIGAGFVAVRKAGKLPGPTLEAAYDLEYGSATLAVQAAAFAPGERVLIIDDVLATGGTVEAAAGLLERAGAEVVGVSVLLELSFLAGRERLAPRDVHSLLRL